MSRSGPVAPAAPGAPEPSPENPLPAWLLVAWALTGLLLVLAAAVSIRADKRAARAEWESRLSRLADDRLLIAERAIREWRQEVRLLSQIASVRAVLSVGGANPQTLEDSRQAFAGVIHDDPHMTVAVVDASGTLRSSLGAGSALAAAELIAPALEALARRSGSLTHPLRRGANALTLEFSEPIIGATGRTEGAVLLAVNAAAALGEHFPRASVPSQERLFVVVPEGDALVVVAPESWGEAGGSFRLPASDSSTFAAAAVSAPRRYGEFTDGRGHRVIAATRRIPEIGWALVVEVDRDTALSSQRGRSPWIAAAAVAVFVAVTALGLAWRRAIRLRHYKQLSDRDRRYRALLEQTQEAVAVSVDGKVVYANPACVDMFGYERPLIGVPVSIFFAPGSREQVEDIVKHRIAGRPAPELYEAIGLRADGSHFDVEIRVTPIEFEGKPASQAVLRDITGRKRMEAGLRESEGRYRLLFERNLSGVYRSTADGRLLECNRAFATMMGYSSPAEALAQPAVAYHESARGREEFLARLRRDGSLLNYETQARRRDGSLIRVIENVSLIRSDDDEEDEETLLGTVFDVTERRQLEEQLLQSQKMEAVGRLAGGIAHDFNNLLTAVSGYTELLLSELPEGDPRRESAEEIRQAGDRAASLTRQLLAFSRRQVLEPRVLDLNAAIADMEKLLRRVIGEDIELTSSLDPELWRTRADPGQIEQAILNLVVNARDAMPRGGRLTLETANVELDEKFARGLTTVHPGPHVMLAVSDTGLGMSPELQARLFEPFFTTKERGKGTGLGLSTTYGIVKQSGGSIWVYSEPGQGTTFKIYLPRCEEPLDAAPEAPPVPAIPMTGSETVLLVEDEPEVRRLVEKLLRKQGYTVIAAAGPGEAIPLAGSLPRIDILLTDVIMPGMNGRELARSLAGRRPGMRVLYMSGYADTAIAQQGILEPGTAFLSKPFTPDALARKMREVLDAPAQNLKSS